MDLHAFERQLRRAGVAGCHARRTRIELQDHLADLTAELRSRGMPARTASRDAAKQLGSLAAIAEGIVAQRELGCWYRRWPRVACLAYPLLCAAVLPIAPVVASARHAPLIVRWGACGLLSAGFTASLLLVLQLSISQ